MRLGFLTDIHYMSEPPEAGGGWHGEGDFPGVLARLELSLAHFAGEAVDAVIVGGDLVHHGDERAADTVLQACAKASAPVIVVSGNHDADGDHHRIGRSVSRAGKDTCTLATAAGVVIGGVRVAGVHVGQMTGWFGASLGAHPRYEAWGDDPVVLVTHYPALSLANAISAQGFPYPGDLLDRAQLAAELGARAAQTVVLCGHVHARASATSGPVLQLAGGALVEPPYECAVINVHQLAARSTLVERQCTRLQTPVSGREPVLAPEKESWFFDGMTWNLEHQREPEEQDEEEHEPDPDHAHR
jgi:3',5'-cyclic AMP phosphodiesterase CpdA